MTTTYVILTIAAIVLMLAECFLPGGVAFALGFAILPVIALHYAGAIGTVGGAVGAWIITSLGVAVAGQAVIQHWFPPEKTRQQVDEDDHAFGQVVEVLEDIGVEKGGRIRWQGTSWSAVSLGRPLKKGDKAKLVARENLDWVVEPVDADGDGSNDLWDELEPPPSS